MPHHYFGTIASRKGLKKAIDKGLVTVNGRVAYSGDHISGGETIERFEAMQQQSPILELKVKVLYEDEHLAVVCKPAGLEVSGNRKWTLQHALAFNLTASSQPDALPRPEPVHRIDHPTTGAVLVGKTVAAVMALNRLFETRAVTKTYHAICIGHMPTCGEMITPVDDKPSSASFTVLSCLASTKYGGLNLLCLHPHTGRRHQLRKQLAEMGNPILGDREYGIEGRIMTGNGLYLHASSLRFTHPVTNGEMTVKADLPKKFLKLFPDLESGTLMRID
ncbi:MAG: RluA family pseudouridine synthase [Flavobacteriales bacterium]|nr:RluA family pseudouridine synthase [Flavobacteriales bacterium]